MRKYLRRIAKARMKACSVGNINKKMGRMNKDGVKLWRAFLFGEYAEQSLAAQTGKKISKRKIRKLKAKTA